MKKYLFSLLFIFVLFFAYSLIADDNAILVSNDDSSSTQTPKYKSIIPWRKGVYVAGNVDDHNPEMVPKFSQEIVEGIRSNRKNDKTATTSFYRDEDTSFDDSSPVETSPYR